MSEPIQTPVDAASISPWMAGAAPPPAPPLAGEVDVDVAVVGAGYTGLSAALALRDAGLSVAVLEREWSGFGASGRNAGHLTPTIGKDLPTLLRLYGRTRAREIVALAETAVEHVAQTLETCGIDCAYHPSGNVVAAVHPRQHARLERAARAGEQIGARVELLDPEAMRKRGLPRAFTAGYLEACGGTLDPGRYVRGLRRVALERGVALFEGTPVEAIEDGTPIRVRTPAGSVRARRLVLGTNAFTGELGYLRYSVTRLHVSLFETAPLSDAQREALEWPGREGIYTAHEMLESYRLTERNTLIGGAKWVRYGFGGRALPDDDPATFTRLEALFRSRFPELADLPVARFWSGPIAIGLDFLPVLGRTGKDGCIVYAVGFAGHGVALASYAGRLISDLVLAREGPGRFLVERLRLPLPPEPLRWLLLRGIVALLSLLDARVDRAARRRSGAPT